MLCVNLEGALVQAGGSGAAKPRVRWHWDHRWLHWRSGNFSALCCTQDSQGAEPQMPEPFCLRISPFFCNLGPNAAEFDLFSFDLFLPRYSMYQEWMKIKVCSF